MAAAAAFASCAKESVESRGAEDSEIGFSTHLTRGASIADAAGVAAEGGFSVWAYRHTGSWDAASDKTIYIDAGSGYGHVTSADGVDWDYGTPKYWPLGKMISSFACAPHGYATPTGDYVNDVPVIACEVAGDAASQKDFMIAAPVLDAVGPDPVKEVFHHALSRITFSALKADLMLEEVKITAIELRNIHGAGTAALQLPVSWNVGAATRDFIISGASLLDVALDNQTAQNITASDGAMFLMPQNLDAAAEIAVTFTVGGDLELSWSGPVPAPAAWLPSTSYNYRILVDYETVVIICGRLEPLSGGGDWGEF